MGIESKLIAKTKEAVREAAFSFKYKEHLT
jgi:hypothetical protein